MLSSKTFSTLLDPFPTGICKKKVIGNWKNKRNILEDNVLRFVLIHGPTPAELNGHTRMIYIVLILNPSSVIDNSGVSARTPLDELVRLFWWNTT